MQCIAIRLAYFNFLILHVFTQSVYIIWLDTTWQLTLDGFPCIHNQSRNLKLDHHKVAGVGWEQYMNQNSAWWTLVVMRFHSLADRGFFNCFSTLRNSFHTFSHRLRCSTDRICRDKHLWFNSMKIYTEDLLCSVIIAELKIQMTTGKHCLVRSLPLNTNDWLYYLTRGLVLEGKNYNACSDNPRSFPVLKGEIWCRLTIHGSSPVVNYSNPEI